MRTAVLRIDVDPGRELTVAQRVRGLARLRVELADLGAELLSARMASTDPEGSVGPGTVEWGAAEPDHSRGVGDLPNSGRSDRESWPAGGAAVAAASVPGSGGMAHPPRELQFVLDTDDAEASLNTLVTSCAKAFGTTPQPGVVTYVSRGTDDDAHGVLAGFGLRGEVTRTLDDDGFDIVHVRLREDDLRRVPESRVHTALEASLNCEVRLDIH